jgi:hypothetical protein
VNDDHEAFRQGRDRIQAIIDNPALEPWHEPSHKLLDVWRLRAEPESRLNELGTELATARGEEIGQAVTDFLSLMERHPELGAKDDACDLAVWVGAMAWAGRPFGTASLARWRKSQSPTWLLAALASAEDPAHAAELIQAAYKVPVASPAFDSICYYAVRLATAAGRRDDARRLADRALSRNLQRSARNWILTERLELARNWDEFLRFAPRRPEAKIEEYDGRMVTAERPPLRTGGDPVFDADVRHRFDEHVPLVLWLEASHNKALSQHLQLQVALSGWMRAVILDKQEDARALMQRVAEIQPQARDVANQFLDARGKDEAGFAAAYLSLWAPTLGPRLPAAEADTPSLAPYRPSSTDVQGRSSWSWFGYERPQDNRPHPKDTDFLTPSQRTTGEREWRQIHAAPPWQATYLLKESLAWAQSHDEDPRVPRALHMAVRASRYRQTDSETGKYSKQAFDLLHRRYPKSEWTSRTPYWYK